MYIKTLHCNHYIYVINATEFLAVDSCGHLINIGRENVY